MVWLEETVLGGAHKSISVEAGRVLADVGGGIHTVVLTHLCYVSSVWYNSSSSSSDSISR